MARSLERMPRLTTGAREATSPSWARRRCEKPETSFRPAWPRSAHDARADHSSWPRGRTEPLSEGPAAEGPLLAENEPAEEEAPAEEITEEPGEEEEAAEAGELGGDFTLVPASAQGSARNVTAPSGQKTKVAPPPKSPPKKPAAKKAPAKAPPAKITSQTVATAPADRTRTTVGVGEEVNLTHSGRSVKWSATAGTLSARRGRTVKFTAPDTAQKVTITGGKATLDLTVIAPNGVHMDRFGTTKVRHRKDRPDSGIQTRPFLLPDTVNFYNVQYHEVDAPAASTGVYSPFAGVSHDPAPATLSLSNKVVAGKGTEANARDEVYSGDPGTAAPFAPGNITFSIPYEYKVGAGSFKNFATVAQTSSLAAPDDLQSVKAGASGATTVGSATSTY